MALGCCVEMSSCEGEGTLDPLAGSVCSSDTSGFTCTLALLRRDIIRKKEEKREGGARDGELHSNDERPAAGHSEGQLGGVVSLSACPLCFPVVPCCPLLFALIRIAVECSLGLCWCRWVGKSEDKKARGRAGSPLERR